MAGKNDVWIDDVSIQSCRWFQLKSWKVGSYWIKTWQIFIGVFFSYGLITWRSLMFVVFNVFSIISKQKILILYQLLFFKRTNYINHKLICIYKNISSNPPAIVSKFFASLKLCVISFLKSQSIADIPPSNLQEIVVTILFILVTPDHLQCSAEVYAIATESSHGNFIQKKITFLTKIWKISSC